MAKKPTSSIIADEKKRRDEEEIKRQSDTYQGGGVTDTKPGYDGNDRPNPSRTSRPNSSSSGEKRFAGDAVKATSSDNNVNNPYESRLQELQTNNGLTRDQAIANQKSAVNQGADLNNDGAVTNKEWTQSSAMRGRVDELMKNRGFSREEALGNQRSAVKQGADLQRRWCCNKSRVDSIFCYERKS